MLDGFSKLYIYDCPAQFFTVELPQNLVIFAPTLVLEPVLSAEENCFHFIYKVEMFFQGLLGKV